MKPEQLTDWIFEMNDWLLPFQQWEQVKAEDCKGRFYDPDKPWGLHTRQAYPLRAWQMRSNSPPMRETPIAPKGLRTGDKRALRDVLQLQLRTDVDLFYISKRKPVVGAADSRLPR